MIHRPDIKKLTKKLLHTQDSLRDLKIMHPLREWGIGVMIGLLIILISGAWSANLYLAKRAASPQSIDANLSDEETVYRASLVEEALRIYSDRAAIIRTYETASVVETTPAVEELETAASSTTPAVEELPAAAPLEEETNQAPEDSAPPVLGQ